MGTCDLVLSTLPDSNGRRKNHKEETREICEKCFGRHRSPTNYYHPFYIDSIECHRCQKTHEPPFCFPGTCTVAWRQSYICPLPHDKYIKCPNSNCYFKIKAPSSSLFPTFQLCSGCGARHNEAPPEKDLDIEAVECNYCHRIQSFPPCMTGTCELAQFIKTPFLDDKGDPLKPPPMNTICTTCGRRHGLVPTGLVRRAKMYPDRRSEQNLVCQNCLQPHNPPFCTTNVKCGDRALPITSGRYMTNFLCKACGKRHLPDLQKLSFNAIQKMEALIPWSHLPKVDCDACSTTHPHPLCSTRQPEDCPVKTSYNLPFTNTARIICPHCSVRHLDAQILARPPMNECNNENHQQTIQSFKKSSFPIAERRMEEKPPRTYLSEGSLAILDLPPGQVSGLRPDEDATEGKEKSNIQCEKKKSENQTQQKITPVLNTCQNEPYPDQDDSHDVDEMDDQFQDPPPVRTTPLTMPGPQHVQFGQNQRYGQGPLYPGRSRGGINKFYCPPLSRGTLQIKQFGRRNLRFNPPPMGPAFQQLNQEMMNAHEERGTIPSYNQPPPLYIQTLYPQMEYCMECFCLHDEPGCVGYEEHKKYCSFCSGTHLPPLCRSGTCLEDNNRENRRDRRRRHFCVFCLERHVQPFTAARINCLASRLPDFAITYNTYRDELHERKPSGLEALNQLDKDRKIPSFTDTLTSVGPNCQYQDTLPRPVFNEEKETAKSSLHVSLPDPRQIFNTTFGQNLFWLLVFVSVNLLFRYFQI